MNERPLAVVSILFAFKVSALAAIGVLASFGGAWAQGYGIVGRDGGWKGPVPDEFRVKREAVYEFARKPTVTRQGDTVTIRFTSKAYCDATVAVEDADGKIIYHLASGVLGPKAPVPFKKNSKEQVLVWDGKNDQGIYVDDMDTIAVRVSLGLRPRFERTLLWSPHKQRGSMPMFAAAPEGVYVYDAGGVDYLRLFDHAGNYVRTIYPFPANKLKEVKGLRWYKFPQGYSWPLKESLYQQTFLTSGVNDHIHDRLGRTGAAATGIAVRGARIALGYEHLNRLSTDGASGGLPLKGPGMGLTLVDRRRNTKYVVGPTSLAFSPNGKTLYYTGWMWSSRFNTGSVPAVMRLNYESNDKPEVFAGSRDRAKFGKGDDRLCLPTSVACGPKGNVYVSDSLNDRVQVFSPAGKLLKSIGVKRPAKVLVHQKTGAIYVFSWAPFGIPNRAWQWYRYDPNDTRPALTYFSPYPRCSKLSAEPFPFGGTGQSVYMNQGARYRIEIDSWAPGDEPTFWLMGRIWMASREDHALRFISATKQLDERRWTNGVRILKKRGGKWTAVVNFARLAKKKVRRINPLRHNIQELFVNPANGKLYVGETDSGPVSRAYNRLIEVDPESGAIRFVPLPFNAEEMVFDINGLAYLRTTDVVARYDSKTWREVPWDYGEALKSVGCGMGGRSADVIAGIRMPSVHPGCFHQGGMSISPKGHLVVACGDRKKGAGKKWHRDFAHFGVAKDFAKPYEPRMYPGRQRGGTCLHVWDQHGKAIRQDVVMGLPQLDGVHIDKDDNIYVMAWPTRVLNGKRYFNYMTETLMKFSAGKGRILMAGKRPPVPLPDNLKPDRPPDVTSRWIEDAEWFYGGVGFAGFNTPHADGGCACWYCRFTMDYFARSFAPEMAQFSVAIVDSSGNLITRVGTYGNVDDGVPLVKDGGPANPRALGGDGGEVALFHAAYVATHTDRRLFISDLGNARIVSVKLGYHAEERVPLKDVPATQDPK